MLIWEAGIRQIGKLCCATDTRTHWAEFAGNWLILIVCMWTWSTRNHSRCSIISMLETMLQGSFRNRVFWDMIYSLNNSWLTYACIIIDKLVPYCVLWLGKTLIQREQEVLSMISLTCIICPIVMLILKTLHRGVEMYNNAYMMKF